MSHAQYQIEVDRILCLRAMGRHEEADRMTEKLYGESEVVDDVRVCRICADPLPSIVASLGLAVPAICGPCAHNLLKQINAILLEAQP